jgi:hypothetical protein
VLAAVPRDQAGGALLFTCNGRGTRMFPEPHHDARAIADILGDIPVAGFFCNGEIVAQSDSDQLDWVVPKPGVYRAEVWLELDESPQCWILSSPFYLK